MKMGSVRSSRLVRHVVALAVALGVFAFAPPAPRAQAASDPNCNINNPGQLCKVQEDCVWFVFYKKCTTQYWRQPIGGILNPGNGLDPLL